MHHSFLFELKVSNTNNHNIAECLAKISEIPGGEDEAFKYFVNIVVPRNTDSPCDEEKDSSGDDSGEIQAARSYRAMTMLKQDISLPGIQPVLIKNPEQGERRSLVVVRKGFVGRSYFFAVVLTRTSLFSFFPNKPGFWQRIFSLVCRFRVESDTALFIFESC